MFSGLAWGDERRYPAIGMEYDVALRYDHSQAASPEDKPHRTSITAYPDIGVGLYFRFASTSEIRFSAEIKPEVDLHGGESSWFGGTELTVKQLYYSHQADNSALGIGKIQIPPGRAMEMAPGLYTADFLSGYDREGVLGIAYAHRFMTRRAGVVEPGVSLHTQDNSLLGRSYLQSGKRVHRSDGGAANTGRLDSYAAALNWHSIPAIPTLELQAGYMRNRKGRQGDAAAAPIGPPAKVSGALADETVTTASLRYGFPLSAAAATGSALADGDIDIVPFVEFADIRNADGQRGADVRYLTSSLTFEYERWVLGITYTGKKLLEDSRASALEYISELSVLCSVSDRLSLVSSVGRHKQDGRHYAVAGLSLIYSGGF